MELGTIFYENQYDEACNYSAANGYTIKEVKADENGKRRFQIVEIPPLTEEQILDTLRARREEECFSYVNRGALWYNTLTTEQQQELNTWYQAWLDVPQVYLETKPSDIETIIPEKPSWLK